ncbi:MAG: CsgG/HfaB family protein [Pseudomonadota bacterium]
MKRMLMLLLSAVVVGVPATALAAKDKITVGVVEFKNESGAGWWRGGVGWELSGMLSNELVATKAFSVVERNKLQSAIEEQNLGASGRVSAGTGAKIGKLIGAEYLVMGTVTAYEENTADTGGGISFRGISVGGNSSEAYIAVDLRVVNSTTGEIEYVRTVEARSKGGGLRLGAYRGGFGGNLASQNKTPAGKAIRGSLIEISDYLECAMVKQTKRCMKKYDERDERRRESSRSAIDLDG